MNTKQEIPELIAELTASINVATKEPVPISFACHLLSKYYQLGDRLYQLRSNTSLANSDLGTYYEDHAAEVLTTLSLLREPTKSKNGFKNWLNQYHAIWRRELGLFLFTLAIFLFSCVAGWSLSFYDPDLVYYILGQEFIEAIQKNTPWFESLQENPFWGGLSIAINNIKVSIYAFLFASLAGIGGILTLIFNGLLFGAVMSYCYLHNFDGALINFVMAHGPLELSIIVASCFAGLVFGRSFYWRPFSELRNNLYHNFSFAITLAIGIIPWLILAAIIEAYVSPFALFDEQARVTLGVLAATIFWIWNFPPKLSRVQ